MIQTVIFIIKRLPRSQQLIITVLRSSKNQRLKILMQTDFNMSCRDQRFSSQAAP